MIDIKQYDFGGIAKLAQSGSGGLVDTMVRVSAPLNYIPMKNEIGVLVDGIFRPVIFPDFGKDATPSNEIIGPTQNSEIEILVEMDRLDAFPSGDYLLSRTATSGSDFTTAPPEFHSDYCLDTALHKDTPPSDRNHANYVRNPGLIWLSPSHFLFSAPVDTDDADKWPIQWDIDWSITAEWEKTLADEGTLTLEAPSGLPILYDIAGGTPATEYTGPITIDQTRTVTYTFDHPSGYDSPFGAYSTTITFSGSDSPASFDEIQGETIEAVPHKRDSFPWHSTATWTRTGESAGTLALSSRNSTHEIYYSTDGGAPGTEYTAPISISSTTQVRWELRRPASDTTWRGYRKSFAVYDLTITDTPNSFSLPFPVIGYDGDDDASTIPLGVGEDPFNGIAYRYVTSGTPTPTTRLAAANGTRYTGPFLPSASATYYVIPFRYGMKLSSVTSKSIYVKVGKLCAEWDGTDTLTLSCISEPTATIKYSLDGGAPTTTYSTPLTIEETKTVKFKAEKSGKVTSDIFTFDITFSDDETPLPPAAFVEYYWSSLPDNALTNASAYPTVAWPMPKADYYISPSGTGAGTSPDAPSNWETILGYTSSYGTAAANSIVWAAEGTYTLPQDTAKAFYARANCRVYGGFNSTFTERDIKGRPSILKSTAWSSSTAINERLIYTSGLLDGFTLDPDFKMGWESSMTVYLPSQVWARCLSNCNVDIDRTFSTLHPSDSVGSIRVEAEDSLTTSVNCMVNCDISIDIAVADGGDNPSGDGGSSIARAGARSDCGYLNRITISADAGDGGDSTVTEFDSYTPIIFGGSSFVSASAGHSADSVISLTANCGNGGNGQFGGNARCDIIADAERSDVTMVANGGNGGDGSREYLYYDPEYPEWGGFWLAGNGGAALLFGNMYLSSSTCDAEITNGDGGNSGGAGDDVTSTRGVSYAQLIYNHGRSGQGIANHITASIDSGIPGSGEVGYHDWYVDWYGGEYDDYPDYCSSSIEFEDIPSFSYLDLTATAAASGYDSIDAGAFIGMPGSNAFGYFWRECLIARSDDISITESPATGCDGNPSRHDGTDGLIYQDVNYYYIENFGGNGYFSGDGGDVSIPGGGSDAAEGGDGVPIAGLETPGYGGADDGADGIQRGRYWE